MNYAWHHYTDSGTKRVDCYGGIGVGKGKIGSAYFSEARDRWCWNANAAGFDAPLKDRIAAKHGKGAAVTRDDAVNGISETLS